MADIVRVQRYGRYDPTTKRISGDFLRVDGIELGDTKVSVDMEYERAKIERPDNPAMAVRPMFKTGSPYADEILALHGIFDAPIAQEDG